MNTTAIEESKEYDSYIGEEQKLEPFNLESERQEGFYDQFLNYHTTVRMDDDAYLKEIDNAMKTNKEAFQLSQDQIKKHLKKFEIESQNAKKIGILSDGIKNTNNNNNIDHGKYWSDMCEFFETNDETVEQAIRRLSKIKSLITKHDNLIKRQEKQKEKEKSKVKQKTASNSSDQSNKSDKKNSNSNDNNEDIELNEPSSKKRKLNDGRQMGIDENNKLKQKQKQLKSNQKKKKKKKKKRSWELSSSEDETEMSDNGANGVNCKNKKSECENYTLDDITKMAESERKYFEKAFDVMSESSTILFSNGDKHIFEMTRNGLINRVGQYNALKQKRSQSARQHVGNRTAPTMGDAKLNAENAKLTNSQRQHAREEARRELEEMRRERKERENAATERDLAEMRTIRENLRKQQELELQQERERMQKLKEKKSKFLMSDDDEDEEDEDKDKNRHGNGNDKKQTTESLLDDFASSDEDDDGDKEKEKEKEKEEEKAQIEWYYYWEKDPGKQEYGPFTNESMKSWNKLNYFQEQVIYLRTNQDKENGIDWRCSNKVDLSTLFSS